MKIVPQIDVEIQTYGGILHWSADFYQY